jgi:two-component system NarL family sensor kinase
VLANALTEQEVGRPVVGLRMLADWPYSWPASTLFKSFANTTLTGEPLSKEYYLERDGSREWYYWRGVRLEDGLVATFENITPRKEAEQALRQAHKRLQTIFRAVPVELGYYHAVRDEASQLLDLRMTAANDASLTRIQQTNHAGEALLSAQLPGLREMPVWQRIQEVLATGQQQRFELYHDFGTVAYWFDTVYTRLEDGIISASLDITTRKQMEQALRESKDLLHAIFNATLDSLEVLRSVRDEAGQVIDFEWVLTNEAAQRLMKRSDLAGKRLLAEEPAMQTSGVFERLRQVADQQQATDFEQHYPFDGDGEWFHVAAAPLGDGVVVNWHDITARKKAAAELLRLQLAQQQQLTNAVLDAQESERHRIAESLHNGLGQLLYATQLHLSSLAATASPQAFAEGKRKTEHLLKTAIDQARTLSHQLTPNILQDFGLEVAVQDICRDFDSPQLRLHSEVRVSRSLPPSLALALYRMVQELINNVAKHAHATEASLRLVEHDGWVELQADDNGRGFDHTQPRTKGLGLNALRDRVKLLNGLLAIISSPGQGTHVNIRIPLVAPLLEVPMG